MGILRQTVEIIRPANTTAYAANDVIGPASGTSLITFEMPSDRVVISGAQVMSDQNWEPTQANLYLVTSSSYAPGADNAALTVPVYADGSVTTLLMGPDISGSRSLSAATFSIFASSIAIPFSVPASLTSHRIYAALQTSTGFTPTSGQKFSVSLFFEDALGRF